MTTTCPHGSPTIAGCDLCLVAFGRLGSRATVRHDRAPSSPPPVDHEVAATDDQVVSRQVARVSLPAHSAPNAIAALFRRLADALDKDGLRAEDMVGLLASRGFPNGTLGDGGPRSSSTDNSIDRAVLGTMPDDDAPRSIEPGPWAGAEVRYHQLLREAEQVAQRFESLHGQVMAHGKDDDPVPAGTGYCKACNRFCRPTKTRPGHRLRSDLCPSCYGAWRTAGQPHPRTDWIRARRNRLTDATGVLHPEDDSHLDLSSERLPVLG